MLSKIWVKKCLGVAFRCQKGAFKQFDLGSSLAYGRYLVGKVYGFSLALMCVALFLKALWEFFPDRAFFYLVGVRLDPTPILQEVAVDAR